MKAPPARWIVGFYQGGGSGQWLLVNLVSFRVIPLKAKGSGVGFGFEPGADRRETGMPGLVVQDSKCQPFKKVEAEKQNKTNKIQGQSSSGAHT